MIDFGEELLVREIAGGDRVELTLDTKAGRRTVLWGGPDDAAVKAPFEHMLRNAIAHGIETPAEREATLDVTVPEAPVTR